MATGESILRLLPAAWPAAALALVAAGVWLARRRGRSRGSEPIGPAADAVSDLTRDVAQSLESCAAGAAVATPLYDGDRLTGVVALLHERREDTEAEARFLADLARRVAAALRDASFHERARLEAAHTGATGAGGSRQDAAPHAEGRLAFGSFDQEVRRAERAGLPLSIIHLAVDQMEAIRERSGAAAGDRVLRGVARAVRSQLRPGDTCVRDAGDAFIVIVPGVGAPRIEAVMARIETAVRNHKFALARGQSVRVAVCQGAATLIEDGRSYDALVTVAQARRQKAQQARAGTTPQAGALMRYPGRSDVPLN